MQPTGLESEPLMIIIIIMIIHVIILSTENRSCLETWRMMEKGRSRWETSEAGQQSDEGVPMGLVPMDKQGAFGQKRAVHGITQVP